MNLPLNLREKLRNLPDEPGCYMMRDRRGRIIYVGKAVSLRKRIQSYFRLATFRRGDPKLRGLVKSVHDLDFIVVRNEAEAVLTEGRLIKEYRPRYNVSFKDDKRFILLRAETGLQFPRFNLCRIRRDDGCIYFGPYVSSQAARATLDFIEKKFGLRKCSPLFPDDKTYEHCINDIVRYCSAPCVGKITQQEYFRQFGEACAFLRGERLMYLSELKEGMDKASENMEFEKAAAIRDTLQMLRTVIKQRARIASTPVIKKEEGRIGVEELRKILRLKKVPDVIEAFDISNISGTYAVASMVCSERGIACRNRYRRFKIKTVDGIDDSAMMAEVIARRFSRLLAERKILPDLVLVDGGIAQMRAARGELDKLGLNNLPVSGLAKRNEEIYPDGKNIPVLLPDNSPALKVLQRLRDEAHRFALTYHQQLRNRCIRESALDDVPGIGKKKKKALLGKFGSVRRIMNATEDQIASVPGIGYELARAIKGMLGRV
ncbi:MAG: excinuclease ABC subunit UvrC [Kiritimatiellae bacterium]|nr:excinuclease ABC subunit UvrC [Kiritimatiellia bacterium]MDD5523031.1 excinuclease ABC subunit UvrC [Kiritimatiellia bacterium]